MKENFIETWPNYLFEQGVVDCSFALNKIFVCSSLSDIKRVLVNNSANYRISWQQRRVFQSMFGDDSIAFSDGEMWRDQRASLNKALGMAALTRSARKMLDYAGEVGDRWAATPSPPSGVDVSSELFRMSLRAICEVTASWGDNHNVVALAMQGAREDERLGQFGLSAFFRLAGMVKERARGRSGPVYEEIARLVRQELDRRAMYGDPAADFLAEYRRIARDKGDSISVDNIACNVITLLSSAETTAVTMSMFAYFLACHPELQEVIARELNDLLSSAQFDDPRQWRTPPNARAFANEVMRMFPPLPLLSREALGPDVIGGRRVAKGATVFISPYIVHHHTAYWRDPWTFDHHRFLPDGPDEHNPAFMPFGMGARKCAGFHLAHFEMFLVFAALLRRFRFRLCADTHIAVGTRLALRLPSGVRLHLEPVDRSDAARAVA